MVTEEVPCVAPKPLPQIVTQTPLLFWPPVLGPLSRSEKKIRGADCADARVADRSNRDTIFRRLRMHNSDSNQNPDCQISTAKNHGVGMVTATSTEAALSAPLVSTAVTT